MLGNATRGRKGMELLHDIMGENMDSWKILSHEIKMETGQQVRNHVRNLLATAED